MKNMFRKMVSIISAMVLTAGCSISVFKNIDTVSVTAEAAAESEYSELVEEMAVKFNEARTELGLEPVYIVPYLNEISQIRAEEQTEKYSHYRPDGSFFSSIIDVDIVDYRTSGEILAKGVSDVDSIFEAWKESPKHWANITKPDATHVGIGLTYDPNSDGQWYWAAIFVGMWDDSDPLPGQRMPQKSEPMITIFNDEIPVEDAYLLGDVNMDGAISAIDATIVLNAYTRLSGGTDSGLKEEQFALADVDSDGIITASDATRILNYATILASGRTPDWSKI